EAVADAGLRSRSAERSRPRRSPAVPHRAPRCRRGAEGRAVIMRRAIAWIAQLTLVAGAMASIAAQPPSPTTSPRQAPPRPTASESQRPALWQVTPQALREGLKNPTRWLTYGGDYGNQRHSPLTQITPANVNRLTAQWQFQTDTLGKFEAAPLVLDGVIYVTGPLHTGRPIAARPGPHN